MEGKFFGEDDRQLVEQFKALENPPTQRALRDWALARKMPVPSTGGLSEYLAGKGTNRKAREIVKQYLQYEAQRRAQLLQQQQLQQQQQQQQRISAEPRKIEEAESEASVPVRQDARPTGPVGCEGLQCDGEERDAAEEEEVESEEMRRKREQRAEVLKRVIRVEELKREIERLETELMQEKDELYESLSSLNLDQ